MKQTKPPVVVIMGHVDHGKTSILDKIRKSSLAAKEAGEITQAIGAYQAEWKGKKITFIDTPGHEAFLKMRSRGVHLADVAVLVVAANDGVMPQTKESIKIIKEAKIPFLVAINKMDLKGASLEKVKGQLVENEVFVEGYGGNVVVVPLSARTGEGIKELLEMILLLAEMEELKADNNASFTGVIIESKKDHKKGITATLVVKNGTLKLGDQLLAGETLAKVKSLTSDLGKSLSQAEPGQPVEILGWEGLPAVGSEVNLFQGNPPLKKEEKTVFSLTSESKKEGNRIKLILKADRAGSLEAILGCLPSEVQILKSGVGEICESEVMTAKTFKAQIFGFNVKPSSQVLLLAQEEKVKIKSFQIIYELLQDIEKAALTLIDPLADREVLGTAEVLAEFDIRGEKVIGAKVTKGRIEKTDNLCLKREKEIVGEIRIKSMRHGKEEVTSVSEGSEFGVVFSPALNFKKGDLIVAVK